MSDRVTFSIHAGDYADAVRLAQETLTAFVGDLADWRFDLTCSPGMRTPTGEILHWEAHVEAELSR